MESALRVFLVMAVALLALWVPTYLHDNPVDVELSRLGREMSVVEAANEQIRQENQSYRTLVRGLRDDPRVLDRRARESLGMSRTDELIIWFGRERRPSFSSR